MNYCFFKKDHLHACKIELVVKHLNLPIVVVLVVLLLHKLGFCISFKDASIMFIYSNYRWNESWKKNDPIVVVVVLLRKPDLAAEKRPILQTNQNRLGPLSFRGTANHQTRGLFLF